MPVIYKYQINIYLYIIEYILTEAVQGICERKLCHCFLLFWERSLLHLRRKGVRQREGKVEPLASQAAKPFVWLPHFLFKWPWPICCLMPALISYDQPTSRERLFQHKWHGLDMGPKAFIYLSGLRPQFVITQGIMYYACAWWWHHNSRMKYKLWYGQLIVESCEGFH